MQVAVQPAAFLLGGADEPLPRCLQLRGERGGVQRHGQRGGQQVETPSRPRSRRSPGRAPTIRSPTRSPAVGEGDGAQRGGVPAAATSPVAAERGEREAQASRTPSHGVEVVAGGEALADCDTARTGRRRAP